MEDVTAVDDARFEAEVLRAEVPVLVDFWAPRCGPCHALEPVVEELAARYRGRVRFVKLDVDEHADAAQRFGVRAIPTLLLFKGGAVVHQLVGSGAGTRARLDDALQKAL